MKDMLYVGIKCVKCKEVSEFLVRQEDLDKYENNELVQVAFPYLDKHAREMFISGLCKECWNKIFE